ncbi:MAG: MBL fold metallo-hydrolase [Firmicutes bacterium]|nr:MBL fold metallo-hydrolase [Bacillota bacterium]
MDLKWPQKLSPHVYMLGTHHFNTFLVGEESYALIEAGMGCSAGPVVRQFKELSVDPDKLRFIIVMHAHPDHSTGIPYLMDAFPAARVIASPEAQRSLSREKVARVFMAEDLDMSGILLKRGELDRIPDPPTRQALTVHEAVDEGDVIDLGPGCRLQISRTWGHSPCSLSAYLPEDKVMFISDAAGFQTSTRQIFPIFFTGYQAYLDSLERLRKIDADIVAIPHEYCYTGKQEISRFYQFAIDEAVAMKDSISAWLQQGLSHQEMVDRILDEQYRDNLRIYTRRNIGGCADSLIKRVMEID